MLTDWLIYLDYLEENNCNTSFLRLVTPIIFTIIKCNNCNYIYNFSNGNGYGNGYGYGGGYSNGNGFGSGYNNGNGYGFGDGNGNGNGLGYLNSYNEEH